jgi:hypothetical protein
LIDLFLIAQEGSLFEAIGGCSWDIAKYLIEEQRVDMFAKVHKYGCPDLTVLDVARRDDDHEAINFLQPYMDSKPKIYALCMGLFPRLGADSPLMFVNVDIVQEIATHLRAFENSPHSFSWDSHKIGAFSPPNYDYY